MKNFISEHARSALVLLLAAPVLLAQADPQTYAVSVNLHLGMQAISRRENLGVNDFGLGVEVSRTLGQGSLFGELGFMYKPGSQMLLDPAGMPTTNGAVMDADSKDSRKNQVEGITFRLGYTYPLSSGVSIRAGLEVMGAHFRQEYMADVSGSTTTGYFRDTYNGVVDKTNLVVNPFVGFTFPIDDVQTLHLTLTTFSYKTGNYTHVAGSVDDTNGGHTGLDSIQTKQRMLPKVEFTYGIRL